MSTKITIIEHEAEIVTTHGTFKQSELGRVKVKTPEPAKTDRPDSQAATRCPFFNRPCGPGCAFRNETGCSILTDGAVKVNRVCPFSGGHKSECSATCVMYNNGSCRLTGKERKANVRI